MLAQQTLYSDLEAMLGSQSVTGPMPTESRAAGGRCLKTFTLPSRIAPDDSTTTVCLPNSWICSKPLPSWNFPIPWSDTINRVRVCIRYHPARSAWILSLCHCSSRHLFIPKATQTLRSCRSSLDRQKAIQPMTYSYPDLRGGQALHHPVRPRH